MNNFCCCHSFLAGSTDTFLYSAFSSQGTHLVQTLSIHVCVSCFPLHNSNDFPPVVHCNQSASKHGLAMTQKTIPWDIQLINDLLYTWADRLKLQQPFYTCNAKHVQGFCPASQIHKPNLSSFSNGRIFCIFEYDLLFATWHTFSSHLEQNRIELHCRFDWWYRIPLYNIYLHIQAGLNMRSVQHIFTRLLNEGS